ncbi:zinc finger, CCHC-type containing protein [Tanacetum coccineum]
MEDVPATLNSRELKKRTEDTNEETGDGLYIQERSNTLSYYICQSEEHLKRDCPRYNHKNLKVLSGIKIRYPVLELMRGSYHITYKRDYLFDFEEYEDGNTLLGDGRECRVRGISGMSKVFWAEDTTMSTYLVNGSPSSAIGFKTPIDMLGFFGWLSSIKKLMLELVKVKCIFLGYCKGIVGTGLVQVLQGVGFEVEPQEDHAFEVEPLRNVGQGAGSQKREDSNEAASAVVVVEKIYAHESLTFNDIVTCEVIYKWKVGLKEDMDARSHVYVLSNGCMKRSDNSDAKGNVLGLEIVRDQSGSTLRVSPSRVHNEKLVHTLFEGHSILLLEGSLSGDYDVEKNGDKRLPGYDDWDRKKNCVELQGAQGDREAEVFQVSNDDAAVAQRRLEDKQLEEKANTYWFVKEQEKYMRSIAIAGLMVIKGRLGFTNVRTYAVSNFTRAGFEDIDFGWGKAIYAGLPEGLLVIP